MKRENDEIADLFRSSLSNAEMTVRDGFWEKLDHDVPVACQHRRRLIFFRVAAAASVLLVLAASSIAFWYFSPKEELEAAFTQVAVTDAGTLDGDGGVRMKPLSLPMKPVLSKITPGSSGMPFNNLDDVDDVDSLSITLSMSFSFSAVSNGSNYGHKKEKYWQAGVETTEQDENQEEQKAEITSNKVDKKRTWALKAQVGTALPADNGKYKMPISSGVTIEKKLTKYVGVESGLLYSSLRSSGQHLHYLGIPVKMNVTLTDRKKLNIYATVGGIADKCISGAPNNDFKNEPIQLALTAGIGVNYMINDRIALFAEPGVSYHFKTDSKLATVRTERPTNFNLLCGVRMMY